MTAVPILAIDLGKYKSVACVDQAAAPANLRNRCTTIRRPQNVCPSSHRIRLSGEETSGTTCQGVSMYVDRENLNGKFGDYPNGNPLSLAKYSFAASRRESMKNLGFTDAFTKITLTSSSISLTTT